MSINFGMILVQERISEADLLRQLSQEHRANTGETTLDAAIRNDFMHMGIGYYNNHTIIIEHFLPYDSSYEKGKVSALDKRLAALSMGTHVMCAFLDGRSGTYGFAVFRDGERIRRRSVDPNTIFIDQGSLLPVEQHDDRNDHQDEARIFAVSESVIGQPFDKLIFSDETIILNVYEE